MSDGVLAGPGLAPLVYRLPHTASRVEADVVIVDAGRNDGVTSEPELHAAVTRYFTALSAAYPQARLVVVPLTLLESWQSVEYRHVAVVLREVGQAHHTDILTWLLPTAGFR